MYRKLLVSILLCLLFFTGIGYSFDVEHENGSFDCQNWSFMGNGSNITKLKCTTTVIDLEAVFSAPVREGTRTVYFKDLSVGGPTSWLWNFGDGNTSTIQNCSHTYASDGTYQVVLTIYRGNDTSTASWEITIKGKDVVEGDLIDNFDWKRIVNNQTPSGVSWVWKALQEADVSWTEIDIRQENVHKLPGILRLHVPANSVMQGNYWYTDQKYQYGKYCASVKMPPTTPIGGQIGAVPSIWLDAILAPDGTRIQGDNEIDIEYVLNEAKLYFTVHGIGDYKEWYAITFPHAGSKINDPSNGYNTYCIAWYPDHVDFSVNDFGPDQDSNMRIMSGPSTPKYPAQLILWNVSVMDGWGGSRTGNNPINMDVDWVSWTEIDDNVTPPPPVGTIKVLPLGDSISSAHTTWNSYRPALWKLLQSKGYKVDFIGSQRNHGPTTPPNGHATDTYDLDHEGHGGYRVDNFLSNEAGWFSLSNALTQYKPDIVLLHLGTNDIVQFGVKAGWQTDNNKTVSEIQTMIGLLRSNNPNVIILLGQIIPIGCGSGWNNTVEDYNAKLKTLATSLTTSASPIIVVDHYTSFDCWHDFLSDYTHPNASGENKMATNWYNALSKVLPTP
jgi:acyl-CoA thioesterase-1